MGIGEDSKKLGLQKGRPFFEEKTTPHYLNFANTLPIYSDCSDHCEPANLW